MSEPGGLNPVTENPQWDRCIIKDCGHFRLEHTEIYGMLGLWCGICNLKPETAGPCFSYSFHAVGCQCRWHKEMSNDLVLS